MNLTGKKILITQNSLRRINGSEVLTLELALYLKSIGMQVTVYTLMCDNPMQSIFNNSKIDVIADDNTSLTLDMFDYIWVHHQVLPLSIIEDLGRKHEKHPRFIFLHMSGMIALETSYLYSLEETLSSLSLFVSPETQRASRVLYKKFQNLPKDIFPNPAPASYSKVQTLKARSLSSILIISNHPPSEIISAQMSLRNESYRVDLYGEKNSTNYSLINPSILSKYDLIITIGKSVQYAMCAGIPVYIYDHFGGPGYLNEKNISLAKRRNFSGRGFSVKSEEMIVNEIINGYQEALEFSLKNRDNWVNEFSIQNIIPQIFERVKPKNIHALSRQYVEYLKRNKEIVHQYVIANQLNYTNSLTIDQLEKDLEVSQKRINKISDSYENCAKDLKNFKDRKIIKVADQIDKILRNIIS